MSEQFLAELSLLGGDFEAHLLPPEFPARRSYRG